MKIRLLTGRTFLSLQALFPTGFSSTEVALSHARCSFIPTLGTNYLPFAIAGTMGSRDASTKARLAGKGAPPDSDDD